MLLTDVACFDSFYLRNDKHQLTHENESKIVKEYTLIHDIFHVVFWEKKCKCMK